MTDDRTDRLAQRCAYLESLVDDLGGVVWEFDWGSGCFTYVSEAAERLLGFTRQEWMEKDFWVSRIHHEDALWAPEFCVNATAEGRDHEFEYRLVRKDGSVVWVRDVVSVDPEKRTSGALRGILIDITAHKDAQQVVTRKAEEFDALLSATRDSYVRISSDGKVAEARGSGGPFRQSDPRTLVGMNVSQMAAELPGPTAEDSWSMARETGAMVISEYEVTSAHGEQVWESRYLPLDTGDVVILSRDVSDRRDTIRRLKLANERYRVLTEMSPFAVLVTSLDQRILLANPAAARIFEVEDDAALVDRELRALLSDHGCMDDSELRRVEAEMRMWRTGSPAPVSDPIRCGVSILGGEKDLELVVAGIVYRKRPAFLLIARDVTEEAEAERLIREAEARFRNVVDEAPFGILMYEMRGDDLVLAGANPAADRILGLALRPLTGRTILEAFPGLAHTPVPERYRTIALEGGTWHIDDMSYEDSAVAGCYEVNVFQMSHGMVAAVFSDITARVEAERGLKESEFLLSEAERLARLGHYVFDILGDRWTSSSGFDRVFGIGEKYSRDVGGWLALVHPEDRNEMADYLTRHVIGDGNEFDKVYRIIRASDGATRRVHGRGRLEFGVDGAPITMFGTIQDVTDEAEAG